MKQNLIDSKWETLCKIHVLTKHYTLLAEEYNISTRAFLQPMKEQKDAYEHIIRAYTKRCEMGTLSADDEKYVLKNLEKAIGHEYRAYFDTIDYLTICIRELISKELEGISYNELIEVYPEYDKYKKLLINIPQKIAGYREKKDIGSNEMLKFASEYGTIINELIECYKYLCCDVIKEINNKSKTLS